MPKSRGWIRRSKEAMVRGQERKERLLARAEFMAAHRARRHGMGGAVRRDDEPPVSLVPEPVVQMSPEEITGSPMLVHKGFGRWFVMDGDAIVSGPYQGKEAAQTALDALNRK